MEDFDIRTAENTAEKLPEPAENDDIFAERLEHAGELFEQAVENHDVNILNESKEIYEQLMADGCDSEQAKRDCAWAGGLIASETGDRELLNKSLSAFDEIEGTSSGEYKEDKQTIKELYKSENALFDKIAIAASFVIPVILFIIYLIKR